MIDDVESDMKIEALNSFCRAPGSSGESIYVRAHHGKRVIKRKEWIKASSP